MPGFDGSGPRGMGPMTGGGRGYCVNSNPYYGYGRGRMSRGLRRGRGMGVPQSYHSYGSGYDFTQEEEMEDLKSYIKDLERQLKEAKEHFNSLNSEKK